MSGVFEDFDEITKGIELPETEMKEPEGIEGLEPSRLEGKLRTDVPGTEAAIVYGDPEETGRKLDSRQGDAWEDAEGTCGLTSAANVSQLAGKDITEAMTVEYAVENGLCVYVPGSPEKTGGMTAETMETLMEDFCGIKVHTETNQSYDAKDIAEDVIDGRGVIVGLSSSVLWNLPQWFRSLFGISVADHYVTVTGAAIDAATGEVAGFYICDSGGYEACRYVDVNTFNKAFEKTVGAHVLITDEVIRV